MICQCSQSGWMSLVFHLEATKLCVLGCDGYLSLFSPDPWGPQCCCTMQLPPNTPGLADRPRLPWLPVWSLPGPGAGLGLHSHPEAREAARPHCVCLIRTGIREGEKAGGCLCGPSIPKRRVVDSSGAAVVGWSGHGNSERLRSWARLAEPGDRVGWNNCGPGGGPLSVAKLCTPRPFWGSS